ncbi:MAG: hypothetical protein QW699_01405 [Metallosphaera sp.]
MARVRRKGLSESIGFLIILILVIAILIPVEFLILSLPSSQAQSLSSANQYKYIAQEQLLQDFEPSTLNSSGNPIQPIYFVYHGQTAYFVFTTNQSPPVPIVIKSLLINDSGWKIYPTNLNVTISNAKSTLFDYKAIEIELPVSNVGGLGAVTQYGNIIYASPFIPPSSGSGGPPGHPPGSGGPPGHPPGSGGPPGHPPGSGGNPFTTIPPVTPKITEPIQEFLQQYGGNSAAVSVAYLNGSYFDGSWYGPMYLSSGSSPSTFEGSMSGQFTSANISLDGDFSVTSVEGDTFTLNPFNLWINDTSG